MKQQMISRVQQVSRRHQDVKLRPNAVANTFVVLLPPTSFDGLCKKSCVAEVYGLGLESATIKEVSKFTVHTYDNYGQPTLIMHHVSAQLKSLVDGSFLKATVLSHTPSTYQLSYTPTTRGRHQLTVRVNNTEIGTFQVFVQHPPTQLGTRVRVIEEVEPMYITVGDKGELFVTEHWKGCYPEFDSPGQRDLTIGSKSGPLFGIAGIAKDGESNVYVASYAEKLQKFNRSGDLVNLDVKKGKNIDYPWGVGYHNHHIYVCDKDNSRVQVFDSDLNFVRSFGTTDDRPGQLKKPMDIDFDAQGNIYVVDLSKHQVVVFSKDGQYLRHFGQKGQGNGELNGPKGICFSGDYVYVTEYLNHCVSVFRTSGEFVHSFGKKGSGRSELNNPYGIAIDQDGFVFVCDTGNNRIQVF